MLYIKIPAQELFDDTSQTFSQTEQIDLELEHSLISLSKWESKYQKPFLSNAEKTPMEILEYVYYMIISPKISRDVFLVLVNESRLIRPVLDEINAYIESKQSATTFGEMPKRPGKSEVITSELIYYWMVAFNIPFECETWHLNRLFSLIRICNIKQSKPTKQSKAEIAQRNRELNEQRKAQYGTKG